MWWDYAKAVVARELRDAWHDVISYSVRNSIAKAALAVTALAVAYHLSSVDPKSAAWSNEQLAWAIGWRAVASAAILVFAVNILFFAPYQLWKEQKARADAIPIGEQPFDPIIWDHVREFRLYQAAWLWVGKSPPGDKDAPMPPDVVLVLHKLKTALKTYASKRTHALGSAHSTLIFLASSGLMTPDKELPNDAIVERKWLEDCADLMDDHPRFLFLEVELNA